MLVGAGVAVVCALGAQTASADSIGGYPCGLTYEPPNRFVIANCHDYGVVRRLMYAPNGALGECNFIAARSLFVVTSSRTATDIVPC